MHGVRLQGQKAIKRVQCSGGLDNAVHWKEEQCATLRGVLLSMSESGAISIRRAERFLWPNSLVGLCRHVARNGNVGPQLLVEAGAHISEPWIHESLGQIHGDRLVDAGVHC